MKETTTLTLLERAEHEHGQDRPARVLLADDDDGERRRLAVLLETLGYDVVMASSGGAMLDELAGGPPGVPTIPINGVIARARLPGIDGVDALAALRETDWQVPVIVTADDARAATREAAHLGVVAVLSRPVNALTLLAAVQGGFPPPEPAA